MSLSGSVLNFQVYTRFMISGETLRLMRNWKGLVQKQAAKLLGISQPAYSKMEKRNIITGELLEKIRVAFHCTEAEIKQLKGLTPPPRKMNKWYRISLKSIFPRSFLACLPEYFLLPTYHITLNAFSMSPIR